MPGSIPVRNLYYLFLYAWDRFPEGRAMEVGATGGPDVLDLFARVLSNGVRRLLRRGIDRGYREVVEETAAPRGRFLLAETIKRASLVRGRAVCASDELSADVPHNQVLKATLRSLADAEGLNADLAHALRLLHQQLVGVSDQPLSRTLFRRVQLSRNNRHYDLLLRICALVLDNLLPGEGTGHTRFADLLEDEVRMSAVFEAFIRNFYRAEQTVFRVGADHLAWDAVYADPAHAIYLPAMRTDVTLRAPNQTIVIDAKFYQQTLTRHWDGPEKVRSEHLYQLLTYLQHIDRDAQRTTKAEGILLYPRTGAKDLRLDYTLAGHRVRVHTLALDCDWQEIRQDLLTLVLPTSGAAPRAGGS
jgi:5-methylcytosine-specific restriction enzyme subunit McrC